MQISAKAKSRDCSRVNITLRTALVLISLTACAWTQETRSTIYGRVLDESGAVVAGAVERCLANGRYGNTPGVTYLPQRSADTFLVTGIIIGRWCRSASHTAGPVDRQGFRTSSATQSTTRTGHLQR
jgi:hypothetical protein